MKSEFTPYLLSLPERVLRSASALAGGLLHEVGEAALPAGVRRSRLYVNLVEMTLRFMIEAIGEVEGVFPSAEKLESDFLARRTAGGGLEMIGILAFRASPVWILAALADASGAGRHLLAEITLALKEQGLIRPEAEARTVDQILDALENSAGWAAETINAPPLDVAGLRRDWITFKGLASRLPARKIPRAETVSATWAGIKAEARVQNRSIFEISSLMALSAVGTLPERMYRLSRSARLAGETTGSVLAAPLLDHYRQTLADIRQAGFAAYWAAQFRPYLRTAAAQFSPAKDSWTQRMLGIRSGRAPRDR